MTTEWCRGPPYGLVCSHRNGWGGEWGEVWVSGSGDFIHEDVERCGGRPWLRVAMEDFNDFIDSCGLTEMKSVGSKFSWCNGQQGMARSWSKLDRHLLNTVAANLMSEAFVKYLPCTTSDHAPMSFVLKPPFSRYARKLKELKSVLKEWNLRVFGRTEDNIQRLERQIERLEACSAGDALAGGSTLDSHEAIHSGAVDFFSSFLSVRPRRDLSNLSLRVEKTILEEENNGLIQLPSIQEVKDAMFSILIDSSPGPDGFGSGFYRSCWDIVEVDVVEAVRDLFCGIPLPRFYSASYIVLIPKVQQPTGFDKFRSISLCLVVYKVFSKILVRRLSPILSKIVSPKQGAFLPGRSIYKNIALAQEIVHMINKQVRGGNVLIKVDMEKAYDSQKVSKEKSSIFFSKLIPAVVRQYSLRLTSFTECLFPVKYLGAPLVVGRLKHVVSSIPVHLFSVVLAPKALLGALNRLLSNFFWSFSDGKPKRKWVGWHKICTPVQEGGLGLRKLEEVQNALFMKFAWKFLSQQSLWSLFFQG
ncbi:uncharacterized protein LOC118348944 [Juglans regia]|uniref:Uncharacterized protein LOC118348944 n=1 Tax=Juglans regia TaxID=51240 RepID=A0A6P9EGM6_JUGRE|nr:uncharacterized protein LOC118348944 [Juglans regia]